MQVSDVLVGYVCIEENVYKKTLSMLKGAVDTLSVSSPEIISTDIGPVIDEEAKDKINHYIKVLQKNINQNI